MAQVAVQVLGDGKAFGAALRRDLADSRGLSVAVAFAKQSGLAELDLEGWCRADRKLEFLAGTSFFLTELALLRRLEKRPSTDCRIFHQLGQSRVFHPKLYVLDKGAARVVYVGSSNFTRGGLGDNIEANVRLEGPAGAPELQEAAALFGGLFGGEYATRILDDADFEQRYDEMQAAQRAVQDYPSFAEPRSALQVAEQLLLGTYRAQVANKRWLLVTSPENFATCMRLRVWGRQNKREIEAYSRGDVFFFHVTGGRGIAAFGMFTDKPFEDPRPIWGADPRGVFPWRIRLEPLGELRHGVPTKEVLTPLRKGAAAHWFHGFIQQSHALEPGDFSALKQAFEAALRVERIGGTVR
jgi:HKD family nuclease